MPDFGASSTGAEVAAHFSEAIRDKNIIITGASPNSLGGEVLRVLAPYANLIVITGRSEERLENAKKVALAAAPNADIRIVVVDQASLESVRAAAVAILQLEKPFHVLFNNAAISQPEFLEYTSDGFEVNFGIDHLSHFLFTSLIISTIVDAASSTTPARIINTSSRAHFRSGIRWDDPNYRERPEEYSGPLGYAQAKTANILFTQGLAVKLASKNVLSFALHPGTVYTNIIKPSIAKFFIEHGWLNADGTPRNSEIVTWKDQAQGAATYIAAAFDPAIADQSGSYLNDCQIVEAVPHASGIDNAEKLWKLSEELLGITFPL